MALRQVRITLLCVLLSLRMAAQMTPLALADCIRMALAAPSSVTLARQDTMIASQGIRAARAGFLPQAQFANGFIYNSSPPNNGSNSANGTFVALNGSREYQSSIGATWEIDTSGRLRAAMARARADQQIAGANLALSQRDLKRAVAMAYYRLLLARKLVTANRDVLAEAQSFAERTRRLAQSGEVAHADVVKAAAQVSFLEQALRAAELEARLANADLASFWTADVLVELQIVDTLEHPAPPEAAAPAGQPFMRRPEFNLLEAQRRGFQADFRHERSFLYPQLTFAYQYGIDSNRLSIRDRGQAVFFNFNIPVFEWFKNRSVAEQFRLKAQQVQTQREISTRVFSRDYETARARVQLLFEQIPLTEAQVRSSEENLKLSRLRYEGGEGPSLDVVAAQTQLAQARSNYYLALANYANAKFDLEVAAGQ